MFSEDSIFEFRFLLMLVLSEGIQEKGMYERNTLDKIVPNEHRINEVQNFLEECAGLHLIVP